MMGKAWQQQDWGLAWQFGIREKEQQVRPDDETLKPALKDVRLPIGLHVL